MTRIVQCLSHSIESYDQLRLYTDLGYEAVDIGGYIDPRAPHDPKRPAVPDAPFVPEIKAAVDALGTPDNLGAAQSYIPDAVLDWLGDDGVLIYHHYLERLYGQWDHIRDWMKGAPGRRVVWRSVGQSVENNERMAQPFRADGLERVAYSPKERNIPQYAGEDALIRFYKDPDEYCGWTGEDPIVINITQHLRQRDPYTNWRFWEAATQGLPRMALGPGSEIIGGPGELSYEDMHTALRRARAYLYTGTQPASYTLGLIEAMMTGTPVISIGPEYHNIFPYGPQLFEAHEILESLWERDGPDPFGGLSFGPGSYVANPDGARQYLRAFLEDIPMATVASAWTRQRAIELFGKDKIAAEWKAFLG
jgi:hypothetical protein